MRGRVARFVIGLAVGGTITPLVEACCSAVDYADIIVEGSYELSEDRAETPDLEQATLDVGETHVIVDYVLDGEVGTVRYEIVDRSYGE